MPDGQELVTQVEVVTSRPGVDGQTGDAQVVELLARVERPSSMQPGDVLELDVVGGTAALTPAPTLVHRQLVDAVVEDLPAKTSLRRGFPIFPEVFHF